MSNTGEGKSRGRNGIGPLTGERLDRCLANDALLRVVQLTAVAIGALLDSRKKQRMKFGMVLLDPAPDFAVIRSGLSSSQTDHSGGASRYCASDGRESPATAGQPKRMPHPNAKAQRRPAKGQARVNPKAAVA